MNTEQPIFLTPKNFTPLTRTPWAGQDIAKSFKQNFLPITDQHLQIGESWEFSCDPSFPSTVENHDITLDTWIRQNPKDCLSPELASEKTSHILVKLLNAAEPLSLQVHPHDDDPCLTEQECGKPESWLILSCEPGAGLYIGFKEAWSKDHIREAILSGQAKELFQFVPVQPMDYFEIMPGVPHAIGAGITLLEPQRVLPGKSGKTCRFWDWDRLYDQNGQLDPHGSPRELHLEDSLRIVTPEKHAGKNFLETIKKSPKKIRIKDSQILSWPRNQNYQVHHIEICQEIQYTLDKGYGILTAVDGALTLRSPHNEWTLPKGQTAMLPWASFPLSIGGKGRAVLTTPALSNSQWSS